MIKQQSNNHIKYAPFGRRTLVPRAIYAKRYILRGSYEMS